MPRTSGRLRPARLVGLGVVVVLVVVMLLNTKFLSPAELAAAGPKKFDAKATAASLYKKANAELPGKAADAGEVIPALSTDLKAAAQKYQAVEPTDNAYVFPVKTTATVTQASGALLQLQVPGVKGTPVFVPLGTAVNGSVIRDAMGFKFADAPGQSDYQFVGDEIKKLMQQTLQQAAADPASLKGKKVTIVGAINELDSGSPRAAAKPVSIQPVSLEVG